MGANPHYKLQFARCRECAQTPQPSDCGLNSLHRQIENALAVTSWNWMNHSCFFPASCGSITALALFDSEGVSQRNNNVAAAAPKSCAIRNPGTSLGRMPAKV